MHSFADFVLKAEFGVDVLKSDCLIIWCFVINIISMQRDIVQPVLFTLGRLSICRQEINIRIVPEILDIMNIRTLISLFFTISSHVEPADEPLIKILRQFLHSFLLVFPYIALINLAVFLDGFELLYHVGRFVFDEVNAARGEWWHNNIDLSISFNIGEIANEISELAEGLCFFETNLAKPGAEHADGIVYIGTECFNVVNKFIPLLSMHYLPDPVPNCIVLVDLCNTQGLVA